MIDFGECIARFNQRYKACITCISDTARTFALFQLLFEVQEIIASLRSARVDLKDSFYEHDIDRLIKLQHESDWNYKIVYREKMESEEEITNRVEEILNLLPSNIPCVRISKNGDIDSRDFKAKIADSENKVQTLFKDIANKVAVADSDFLYKQEQALKNAIKVLVKEISIFIETDNMERGEKAYINFYESIPMPVDEQHKIGSNIKGWETSHSKLTIEDIK